MKNLNQLTAFIGDIFQRYKAIRTGFYSMYDDEIEEYVDTPLFVGDDETDANTLARLSIHLGMSTEEILGMDQIAARRYWNKYSFFRLYDQFLKEWAWYSRHTDKRPTAEELLIKAIFTDDELSFTERYDFQDIKTRLIAKLKETDAFLPGTYHKDAEITELVIRTEVLFSFPQCAEMIKSFVCMVDRTKELFFKAIHENLSVDEERELNFLASWLRASDVVMASVDITYNNIRTFRPVYLKENLSDFFSYVSIRRFYSLESLFPTDDFVPWRCREFFEDVELAQALVTIFPNLKPKMLRFANELLNFSCSFVWSDANPIVCSPEEEKEWHEVNLILGKNDTPIENRAREVTHVYVEKTPQELGDWEEYAHNLDIAASPSSLGGLQIPRREIDLGDINISFQRICKRVAAKQGEN